MEMQVVLYGVKQEDIEACFKPYETADITFSFLEIGTATGIRLKVSQLSRSVTTLMFLVTRDVERMLKGLPVTTVYYVDNPVESEKIDEYICDVLKIDKKEIRVEEKKIAEVEESKEIEEIVPPTIITPEETQEPQESVDLGGTWVAPEIGEGYDDPFSGLHVDLEDEHELEDMTFDTEAKYETEDITFEEDEVVSISEQDIQNEPKASINYGIVAALEQEISTLKDELREMVSKGVLAHVEQKHLALEQMYDKTVTELVTKTREYKTLEQKYVDALNAPKIPNIRLTKYTRAEFHFSLTPNATQAMYKTLATSITQGTLIIDLSMSSYIDNYLCFPEVTAPRKWLVGAGKQITDVYSTVTIGKAVYNMITSAAQPLRPNDLLEINWDQVFDDVEKVQAEYTKVIIIIGDLTSQDMYHLLTQLQAQAITKVGYTYASGVDKRIAAVKKKYLKGIDVTERFVR